MANDALPGRVYLAAILIGLLPAWMILLPLDITGDPQDWQVFVRANSFAVPLAQIVFVLLAMGSTFSPFQSIKSLPRTAKAALLILVVISFIISFQGEKDYLLASIGMFKLGIAGLFFLALIDLRTNFGIPFLLRLWVSLGIGIVLFALLWTIHIFLISPQGEDWVTRIPGVNNVRHTGHFALAGVVAGLFGVITFRDSTNTWMRWSLPLFLGSTGLGLALWTGSRGPLLASLVTMFATICIASRHRKIVATFCVASALVATAAVALLPVPHPIYGIAGATGMADVSAVGEHDVSSGRTVLWAGTIDKISQRPLLGWGVNQFLVSGPSIPISFFHPHNFPLQLLFSGGIVSLLLSFLIVVPTLRRWKWPYIHGPSAAGVGGVVGILAYSLYDGSLYFSYPITIFLIAIATSIAPASEQRDRDMSGLPVPTG